MLRRCPQLVLAVCVLAICACADDATSPEPVIQPTSSLLDGTWVAENEVIGSGEQFDLTVSDSIVRGSGQWTAEACCGGTLTVDGRIRGSVVHLSTVLVTTTPAAVAGETQSYAFDVRFAADTELVGVADSTLRLRKKQ